MFSIRLSTSSRRSATRSGTVLSDIELAPELPKKLILELGYFASDWGRIEQNILCHTLQMSGGKIAPYRSGFKGLRKHWLSLCRANLKPDDLEVAEKLNDRLHRRSIARNYALHGTWHETAADQYAVVTITKIDDGTCKRENIFTTYDEVRNQTALLRAMRADLATFLHRVF